MGISHEDAKINIDQIPQTPIHKNHLEHGDNHNCNRLRKRFLKKMICISQIVMQNNFDTMVKIFSFVMANEL